ncbi:hypothetical protein L227DRAFT_223296 [Lentinus tigrinus ALCF2SS1-6]|uniref:Uncharacterized protein n=1 Tax=Lentinus tigrinus ALCF2SS1-6 TaxID=1328759 RepID=A0A5C2S2I0_9APHY|nr:hypothetical protein L227DRAFT_223296 [Lentinus tigrinus ALCF2SS1-6]
MRGDWPNDVNFFFNQHPYRRKRQGATSKFQCRVVLTPRARGFSPFALRRDYLPVWVARVRLGIVYSEPCMGWTAARAASTSGRGEDWPSPSGSQNCILAVSHGGLLALGMPRVPGTPSVTHHGMTWHGRSLKAGRRRHRLGTCVRHERTDQQTASFSTRTRHSWPGT